MSISRFNNTEELDFKAESENSEDELSVLSLEHDSCSSGEFTDQLDANYNIGSVEEIDATGAWCKIPGLFNNQRVFLPEQFTPSYAYPLVVSICDKEKFEEKSAFEKISQQNYLGLRINLSELGLDDLQQNDEISGVVIELVQDFQQIFMVNQRQIYLLAEGKLANAVLNVAINFARRFAGLLLVNPQESGATEYPANTQVLRHLRIGIVDELGHPENWNPQIFREIRSLPFRQVSVFDYDDLMVHYNEYEVLNRFLMSGMGSVVW